MKRAQLHWLLAGTSAAFILLSCLNFDQGLELYNLERDGGKARTDGGPVDACKMGDQACSGDECCNDLRCGPATSGGNVCRAKFGTCYEDGLFCRSGDACCGYCDAGTCQSALCTRGHEGASCLDTTGCCPPLGCNARLCTSGSSCIPTGGSCPGSGCCSGNVCDGTSHCVLLDAGCVSSCPDGGSQPPDGGP